MVMSLSLLFAVILTSGIRGKKFFRAIIYMPNIVSAVALATMWLQYVYSPRYGLLKDLFTALLLDNLAKIRSWIMTTNSGHCCLHIVLEWIGTIC